MSWGQVSLVTEFTPAGGRAFSLSFANLADPGGPVGVGGNVFSYRTMFPRP